MINESFLCLVRLGIDKETTVPTKVLNWNEIYLIAKRHGLLAVVLDGIEKLPSSQRPPQGLLLEWIGEVLQDYEGRYSKYKKAIGNLARFYNQHGFKMMILKGYTCSLDWLKPEHRPCGDIDVWLFGQQKEADAALLNHNDNQNHNRVEIDSSQHHHTVFEWNGFTVENHYDFINVHHHPSHQGLEAIFKELGKDDSNYVELSGEKVYLPSPNLHALFLLRHALNHFSSIGINLRNVLDWAFFVEKHTNEIDWEWLETVIDKYHLRDFYNCLNVICMADLGFDTSTLNKVHISHELKAKILNDILNPEFTIHEPNTFCQKWIHKYRRWYGNRWKQKLCYNESRWNVFWNTLMCHLVKPRLQ